MIGRFLVAVLMLTAIPLPHATTRQPDHGGPMLGDLAHCPGASELYATVDEAWRTGRLIVEPERSALRDIWQGGSVLSELIFRTMGSRRLDHTDTPGWLLIVKAVPRYPDNPYVNLTRDRTREGFESYESILALRILASGDNLLPGDVMRIALEVTDGDYPLATLTTHNLLKEIAFAERSRSPALVGWDPSNRGTYLDATNADHSGYLLLSYAEVQALKVRLAPLRLPSDRQAQDTLGPWYHLFGILFLGAVTTGTEATIGAWTETSMRWVGIASPRDGGKELINACGAQLARSVDRLTDSKARILAN